MNNLMSDDPKGKHKPTPKPPRGPLAGLMILLVVVGLIVWLLLSYHENTPSPFHNELFFGPSEAAEPLDGQARKPDS
tara:strand:+ start:75 stop:305 length:231 start_codon:yes stop_codon:yes gene_type:complete